MGYRETLTEHLRLCLLRLLLEAPGYESNNSILTDGVQQFGLPVSRDTVNTELSWLHEQGLARVEKMTGTISVARLTQRGQDVGEGRATVPGVKKRGPED